MQDSKLNSRKIFFALGKLTAIFHCVFLILLYDYLRMLPLPLYVSLPLLAPAFLLVWFYAPLLYDLINNSPFVFSGRYHLPFFLSTVLSAIFTAVLFNLNGMSFVACSLTLFFAGIFAVLFAFVYFYTYSSISIRIVGAFKKPIDALQNAFIFIAICAFAVFYLFYYDFSLASSGIIGYFCACVMVAGGFVAYLASDRFIPKLVRITLQRRRGIKEKFMRFYSALAIRENGRSFISFSLFCLASTLVAISFLDIAGLFKESVLVTAISLILFAVSFCSSAAISTGRKAKIGLVGFVLSLVMWLLSFTALALREFLEFNALDKYIFPFASFLAGVAPGLMMGGFTNDFDEVVKRSNSTIGTILNLRNIILCTAFFVAIIIYSLLGLLKSYTVIATLSISGLFLLASFIVRHIKKKYLTLQFPTDETNNINGEE